MKTTLQVLGSALLLLVVGPACAAEPMDLNGTFVWERNGDPIEGDLAAVFTETEEGHWNVSFQFVWDDGDHTYLGTATGARNGVLRGEVLADDPDQEMRFRFEMSFKNGIYTGRHTFIERDGDLKDNGTLSLRE